MSIASTQLAMGYVAFTESKARCDSCEHREPLEQARGLRCKQGSFYVVKTGTCRHHRNEHAPVDARVQIGPTDI